MATLFDALFGSPEEDEKSLSYLDQLNPSLSRQSPTLAEIQFESPEYLGDYAPTRWAESTDVEAMDPLEARGFDPSLLEGTAFDSVGTDPRLRQAQYDALDEMSRVGREGGMTAQDRARLAQIQQQTATADRGRRDAILQGMRSRGMGGSGSELLAQLQSAQAATDQSAMEGLNVEAMAEQRALDAMARAGQLGGQMRGQEFDEKSRIAQANDAFRQFNAANTQQARMFGANAQNQMAQFNAGMEMDRRTGNADRSAGTSRFNAGLANDAGMASWQARQGIASKRTDTRNAQNMHNMFERPQAGFKNDLAADAGRVAGAKQGMDYWNERGDRTTRGKAGAWEAVGKAGAAVGAMMSDERKKEDKKKITLDDLQEFLGAVKPSTFRYKDPSEPGALPGKRVGFMAQDVKDTKLGKELISERDDGVLQYDSENMQGILLAALKEMAGGKN